MDFSFPVTGKDWNMRSLASWSRYGLSGMPLPPPLMFRISLVM
jgi:hypothetical protein